jgi:hypothetical protein
MVLQCVQSPNWKVRMTSMMEKETNDECPFVRDHHSSERFQSSTDVSNRHHHPSLSKMKDVHPQRRYFRWCG